MLLRPNVVRRDLLSPALVPNAASGAAEAAVDVGIASRVAFLVPGVLSPAAPSRQKKKPLTEVRGEFKQGGFTSGRRRGRPGGWAVPGSRLGSPELSGTLSGNSSLMLQRNIA